MQKICLLVELNRIKYNCFQCSELSNFVILKRNCKLSVERKTNAYVSRNLRRDFQLPVKRIGAGY